MGFSFFIVTENGRKTIAPNSRVEIAKAWIRRKAKTACSEKMLHRRIPILNWLPKYSSDDAAGDLVAGITVGLTVIPGALAYAGIAGVPAAVSYCYDIIFYL